MKAQTLNALNDSTESTHPVCKSHRKWEAHWRPQLPFKPIPTNFVVQKQHSSNDKKSERLNMQTENQEQHDKQEKKKKRIYERKLEWITN